ncbi:MAG: hypothetical protein ALECFALPRED_004372 [Alectoria fallacina]|uniref:Ribosome biogenesis protein SLX9 n=1 Tax=Alectoria fallacina TaxID=1903189 RepID=A0A8H3EPT3_9LECA|nr:MAG: hypothetical protein ALECFALPRED_004372 [Alectoria fallacina]
MADSDPSDDHRPCIELTGRVECTYEGRSTDRDKEWFDEWRLGVHEVLLAGDESSSKAYIDLVFAYQIYSLEHNSLETQTLFGYEERAVTLQDAEIPNGKDRQIQTLLGKQVYEMEFHGSLAPRPPTQSSTTLSHKPPSKRQKRISKHATLLTRITKSLPSSKRPKRRRPSKKLVTSLDSLAAALPAPTAHTADDADDEEAWEGIADGVKMKHKSLKSRPGAGKKKEKLVAMERERFARNLAAMASGSGSRDAALDGGMVVEGKGEGEEGDGTKGRSAERWAAIRGFICQTMERRPEGEGVAGKK